MTNSDISRTVKRWSSQPNGETIDEHDKLFPTGGFKSLGHLAWCVAKSGRPGQPGVDRAVLACKSWDGMLSKQLSLKTPNGNFEESDPDGGVLVPPQFNTELYERTYNQNQLLKYLNLIPIEGRQMKFPAIKEDSRVDGSRHGGTQGYWANEADQYTSSRPRLRSYDLMLSKLTVLVYATSELTDDCPQALENYLLPNAAAEINFKVNDAVVNGVGGGQPLGILKANSKITVAALSGQGANTIIAQNILKIKNRIAPVWRRNMLWLFSGDAEFQITSMYQGTGQYAATNFLTYDDDGQLRILGNRALLIEQCQALGTEGDVIAFAPDSYQCIVKRGIESFMSTHLSYDYDQNAYKFRFRFDGQPKDDVALTPYHGSQVTSGIATLNSTRT